MTERIPYRDEWESGRDSRYRLLGDACPRCKGHGQVPERPGDPRVMVPCRKCAGTGRR